MSAKIQPGLIPGMVLQWAGPTAPTGYLFCAGQAISRTQFKKLYDAIGTVFGTGDGSSTFNLPDCRGRVMAGMDNMGGSGAGRVSTVATWGSGIDGNRLGATGGSYYHTLDQSQLPNHTHSCECWWNAWNVGGGVQGGAGYGGGSSTGYGANGFGNGPHNNVTSTFIVNIIIKT